MSWYRTTGVVLVLVLGLASNSARADGHDPITLGVGVGVMYSSAPGLDASATSFHFNARLKALYFLGLDIMAAPSTPNYVPGESPSALRLSALLYFVNLRSFAMFGAVGMAADDFSDLVNINGDSTHYRAGGGFEITLAGHYSIALEGMWVVPGMGIAEELVTQASLEAGHVVDPANAIPRDGFEMFVGFRYFI